MSNGPQTVPSNVRVFFWLTVLAAAWVCGTNTWFLIFPTAAQTAMLARLPAELHEGTHRAEISRLGIIVTESAILLTLAWLAAFRRQNWARWLFVILFLVLTLLSSMLTVFYYKLPERVWEQWPNPVTHPRNYG